MSYKHINLNGIGHDCWWSHHRHAVLVYEKYPALISLQQLAFKPAVDSSLLTVFLIIFFRIPITFHSE